MLTCQQTPTQHNHEELTNNAAMQGLICFSHLRWHFVYQRPQHLMQRASRQWPVYFWEEPVDDQQEELRIRQVGPAIFVLCPHIAASRTAEERNALQREWLSEWLTKAGMSRYIAWYYSPMMLGFSDRLTPVLTVYDCMDELTGFLGAHAGLAAIERALIRRADLLFTGGYSLFESKKHLHQHARLFPSAIDYEHFAQARQALPEPADQAGITGPKIGFCGVIDERFDCALVAELARSRPEWQFIFLGPVVKIDPASLPAGPNLHYIGMKAYSDLPAYMSNWQVAILPFALNEATRFISPTKTPEYLAAGLPVVSTPIHDVIQAYADWDCVQIKPDAAGFNVAIQTALSQPSFPCREQLDNWLKANSWDATWICMEGLMVKHLNKPEADQVVHQTENGMV